MVQVHEQLGVMDIVEYDMTQHQFVDEQQDIEQMSETNMIGDSSYTPVSYG